ncbi:MAG: C-terminal binding protein [Dehalococcoidia bacterium]|nr:C-terminal binding protein [Dehalococcoidia bacterium]
MSFKAVDLLGISMLIDYEAMFREAGAEIELVKNPCPLGATEDEIISAIGDADAVITQTTFQKFTKKVLGSLPKVRLVSSIGVGYDNLDVPAATEAVILAANVPDASTDEVAEHTLGLILSCTRGIIELNEIVKAGRWTAVGDPHIAGNVWPRLSRLRGQALGIIGLGRIGQAVASRAKAFGLTVMAYDPYISTAVFEKAGAENLGLAELLEKSDIVSLHCPLTAETNGMLGVAELKKMKKTACLINTARGAIVDFAALFSALKEGYIAMAAFDVTEPEPIEASSPLLGLPNFIVTAHSAGISPQAFSELQRRPGYEVLRVYRGEWPVGLLNPEVKESYLRKWKKP